MGLEDVTMFHVMSNGKVKVLTEKEYLARLGRKGYLVGWVDATHLLLTKNDEVVYLHRLQIEQIFGLFDNKEA